MNTILVIDDERPTLSMFTLFLKAYGHEVLTAESGEEGIAVFSARRPSIVLTDIKMPGMDGLQVLKRIKEIDPLAEVIVITGHGDMDIAMKALQLNATDFINKPIKRPELEAALKRARERLHLVRDKEREVTVRRSGGTTIIDIRGAVTARSEPFLAEAFARIEPGGGMVLNFSQDASVNGAGIAVLIQLLSANADSGVRVALAGLSENFRKVLEMVGVTTFAPLHDSLEGALAAVEA